MLIVGYCYDIRFERKLCEEVKLHLGYRWFCRLELDIRLNQRMSTHACSPPFQLADSYD
jgi:transposase